jgi:hypothetical protein
MPDERPPVNEDVDPADRPEPELETAAERTDVPHENRANNAGGTMSETLRSRLPDLDDEDEGSEGRT